MPSEYDVYRAVIARLERNGWVIVCASPPAGTDPRFRRCILPRRKIGGADKEKGLRDEVDVTATRDGVILLVEAKVTLTDSLTVLNALGECDREKLLRLARTFQPGQLAALIHQGFGHTVAPRPSVATLLAVADVDVAVPNDMPVLEASGGKARFFPAGPHASLLANLAKD